jgi:membrane protein
MTPLRRYRPSVRTTWRRGGLSWWQLAQRVWGQIWADEITGRAAELAYFFFFSVFPLLLVLTSIVGVLSRESWELRAQLFDYLADILPDPDVSTLVHETVVEVGEGGSGTTISLGLLFAFWAASRGMNAVNRLLNDAYDIEETRPLWKRRLIALVLTLVFAVFVVTSLLLMFAGHEIAAWSADQLGAGPLFEQVWAVVQWVPVFLLVVTAFEIVYNYAPDLPDRKVRWLTPGAVAAVTLWVAASLGLRLYLDLFGDYGRTYGSLATVIALLIWFYLTAMALLLGGEINSEILKAEREGDPQPRSSSSLDE